jgi:hypothetical protein
VTGGTHHHGPLAGAHWGAVAVLAVFGMLLLVARRQLGELATVAMWAGIVLVCYAALWVMGYGLLRLRLHAAHPETLSRRTVITAEALDTGPVSAIPLTAGAGPAAIEPPRETHNHFHFPDADAAAAAVRAMRDTEIER